MATPTDPLYEEQWHFSLIGDIETIWDDYTGDGVTVAVYDEGVQYDHPDLDDNYDASMHFTYDGVVYDGMPNGPSNGHGTSCAGIIGAENNGSGGVGVAYDVTITGVDYLEDIQFAEQEVYDAALYWAANFDIMSNSWGYSTGFTPFQNLNNDSSTAHDVAIYTEVVATGRDGLGTVILKAAGNETKNANGDGMNASHVVITVAATEQTGEVAWYSNYGSTILVAAPASGVTTDITGSGGYNGPGLDDGDPAPPDYTSQFNGTSAATPTVAGVVALMLEANEMLGWRDVKNILALSAAHTGSDFGGPAVEFEVGSWETMGGTTWNGGGTQFHQSYGHGMVDAYAAVRFAEAWDVLYADQGPQTSENEQVVTASSTGGAAIPDNTGGTALVQVVSTEDISIESIHVTIDVTHENSRDLIFYLVAPDGQMVELYNGDGNARTMDNGLVWTFNVEGLRGYSSEGTWGVVAQDTVTGSIGEIDGVDLTFYGSEATVDDVYHFTDDFMMLAAFEASRTVIDDTNGGVDWLNFAAISADITANMGAGGEVSFNGTLAMTLATGTADFENLYAGDGDDRLTGNSLDNHILGERGVDTIHGNNGDDRIEGGSGNDKLYGDNFDDTLIGGQGNDRMIGGAGDDRLQGNGGRDTFIFHQGFGDDTIVAFQDNRDTLKFSDDYADGLSVAQFIATYATVVGGNTVFDFGDGDVLTITGLTNTSLLLDDIAFL